MSPLEMAALNGRDPSQRSQVIDSANLVATPYQVPNWLKYGNGTGETGTNGNQVPLYVGNNYTLYDEKTGKVLATGSTPEEIQNIQSIISNTLVPQGKNANWRLYSAGGAPQPTSMHERMPGVYSELSTPGDPRGNVVAGDQPNDVFKDIILPMLAPAAGAALAYFGGMATMRSRLLPDALQASIANNNN